MASHTETGLAFIGLSVLAGYVAYDLVGRQSEADALTSHGAEQSSAGTSSQPAKHIGNLEDLSDAGEDEVRTIARTDHAATGRATIETSFGEYVGPGAVCEGDYWRLDSANDTLSWMDTNSTDDLASDDFYVEYSYAFDGETLTLTNGRISAYRLDNPIDGRRVDDMTFPMRYTSQGIMLNGELLQACRN